jgi:hypothetical protein
MMPHSPEERCIPTILESHELEYFQRSLNSGLTLREHLRNAHVVNAHLDLDGDPMSDDAYVLLWISGLRKGQEQKEFLLGIAFHHRFGMIMAMNWRTRETNGAQMILDLCPSCHRRARVPEQIVHHSACPHLDPENHHLKFVYDQGRSDGFRQRAVSSSAATYNLGYTIGKVSREADLARGQCPM